MASDPLTDRVNQVQDQLFQEFATVVGPRAVEDTFTETLAAYRDARIADFVPLFIQRDARDRLTVLARTSAGHEPVASV